MVARGRKWPDRRTVTLPIKAAARPETTSPAPRPSHGDQPRVVLRYAVV